MRIEDKLIIELCKKKNENPAVQSIVNGSEIDLEYFMAAIGKHQVKPLLLSELSRYRLRDETGEWIMGNARDSIIETTLRNRMIREEFNAIRDVLQKLSIDFILMKGHSLDYSGLRTIGDIDLLIRERDLLKASEAMQKIDYYYAGDELNYYIRKKEMNDLLSQLSWNNQFQYYNPRNSLLVELHTNLFERSRVYQINLDTLLDGIGHFWDNRRYDAELRCHTFSDEDKLICLCVNNAIKRALYQNTFILKNVLDMDELIRRGIDWTAFINYASGLGVASFALFSLLLAGRIIETDIPDDVLRQLRQPCSRGQSFLCGLHLRCFNGLEASSLFYSNFYKICLPFVYQHKWLPRIRAILLFHLFFPPRRVMAAKFHLDQNSGLVYFAYLLNLARMLCVPLMRVMRRLAR